MVLRTVLDHGTHDSLISNLGEEVVVGIVHTGSGVIDHMSLFHGGEGAAASGSGLVLGVLGTVVVGVDGVVESLGGGELIVLTVR